MNLYQIDSAIAECVDAESGEVLDFDKLAELSMERDRKIENIALWIKNDLSEAKAIREEEKTLAARRQSLERAAESKKRYLVLYVLIDKHDAPMDDVQQLAGELNHAAQCVAEGYVTWADIRQMLKEYGVETALE